MAEELLHPVQFEDAVAAGAYPIHIQPAAGRESEYASLDDDHAYQIPDRSLCPKHLNNALVAGRGASATHQALAAIRVMTTTMAVGQAAGIAAAGIADLPGEPTASSVDVDDLRHKLQEAGAFLVETPSTVSCPLGCR